MNVRIAPRACGNRESASSAAGRLAAGPPHAENALGAFAQHLPWPLYGLVEMRLGRQISGGMQHQDAAWLQPLQIAQHQ